LKQIALFARKRVVGKVVGVTGSVGKTTTKEMLQFVLSNEGKTYCSIGNFNNHFGLPLCLANMPQDTEYAVLEMGMSSAGELSELSKIAAPDVAVITTVEAVHLEFFSSVSAIAAAKSEIFTGMQTGGTAVINFENPYHPILVGAASQKKLNVMGFSETLRTEYRLLNYRVENGRAYIKAECLGKDIEYQLAILGKHHALNSLGVLAAV
jgi:UDP-N-acetylmuramoyl-tripeptide--D-alanyl-D-alanine ligase